jgi:hypothetical protein
MHVSRLELPEAYPSLHVPDRAMPPKPASGGVIKSLFSGFAATDLAQLQPLCTPTRIHTERERERM